MLDAVYIEVLQKTFLFKGLDCENVASLLDCESGITLVKYKPGDFLQKKGDCERALKVLVLGKALAKKGSVIMSELQGGDMLGAASLFLREASAVTDVIAAKACEAVVIPENVLTDVFKADFRVAQNYMRYLTERIRFLSVRAEDFAQGDVRGKLMNYLRVNAENRVLNVNSISALAKTLSVGRASLYRVMSELESDGIIAHNGKSIRVLS